MSDTPNLRDIYEAQRASLRKRVIDALFREPQPEPEPPKPDADAGKGEGDPRQFEWFRDDTGRPQPMQVFDLEKPDERKQ